MTSIEYVVSSRHDGRGATADGKSISEKVGADRWGASRTRGVET